MLHYNEALLSQHKTNLLLTTLLGFRQADLITTDGVVLHLGLQVKEDRLQVYRRLRFLQQNKYHKHHINVRNMSTDSHTAECLQSFYSVKNKPITN